MENRHYLFNASYARIGKSSNTCICHVNLFAEVVTEINECFTSYYAANQHVLLWVDLIPLAAWLYIIF